jgi:TRAP-type C4-dicarboxylate transport system permease large subunit
MTGGILFIVVNGFLFGWILAAEGVPEAAAKLILSITDSPWVFLLLVNMLLLIAGAFMDEMSLLIILVPVLFPISQQLGIDPIQFGLVICFNLTQGLITPPLGILVLICAQIGKVRVGPAFNAITPFLLTNLAVLALLTFVPTAALFLPRLLGY